jgi:cation diffusion facilitator CzcD-associated flavoprotein CzcO
VDKYPDLIDVLYERQGGHYFDVGASKKILDGQVAVKLGTIDSFTETGLQLEDGRKLDADVIVLATGFEGNMRTAAQDIVEPEVAGRMEEYMRVDREAELRGYAKPMAWQRNVW